MAAEKGSVWPNKKDDYELRDVIGEQLNISDQLLFPGLRLVHVSSEAVTYFTRNASFTGAAHFHIA